MSLKNTQVAVDLAVDRGIISTARIIITATKEYSSGGEAVLVRKCQAGIGDTGSEKYLQFLFLSQSSNLETESYSIEKGYQITENHIRNLSPTMPHSFRPNAFSQTHEQEAPF